MAILALTELQAVNQMLRSIGHRTVATVGSGNTLDAEANTLLDEVAEQVQMMGWPENTEENKSYQPDGTLTGATAFTGGTYTAATRTITSTGSFPGDTTAAGDEIYLYDGTGIKEGYYGITSNADANTIVLDHQPGLSNNTDLKGRAVGPLYVTVGTDILKIKPTGPNRRTRFSLNNQQVLYNNDGSTSRLDNDDLVYLTVVREFTWENLSPALKHLIVATARLEFQRWKKKQPDRDIVLNQERALQDMMAQRNAPDTADELQSFNLAPIAGSIPDGSQRAANG
jgi:hypothetical protein